MYWFIGWLLAIVLILVFFRGARRRQAEYYEAGEKNGTFTAPISGFYEVRIDAVLPKNTPTPFVPYDEVAEKENYTRERELSDMRSIMMEVKNARSIAEIKVLLENTDKILARQKRMIAEHAPKQFEIDDMWARSKNLDH